MKLDKNTLNRVLQESMTDVFNDYIDPTEKIDGVAAEQAEENDALDDPINHSFNNHNLGEMINKITNDAMSTLKENRLQAFIDKTVLREIEENYDGISQFQRYNSPYDGNGGSHYTRVRGYSPKASRHTYPGKEGLETEYGQVDVDREYAPSKNKWHMQQHKNNDIDLNQSINNKVRTGRSVSKYW